MTVLIVQDCHAVCENKDGCTDFTWHSPAAEVFTSTLTFDPLFHYLLLFQVFPNSCFLFSSCINKEYSYGCFSGGRHCRRVESRVCWSGFSTPSSCPMWEHCNSTSIRINATGVAKTMPVTHTGPHLWVSGTT